MARKSSGLADQNKTRRLLSAIPCGFARPPTALRKRRPDDARRGIRETRTPTMMTILVVALIAASAHRGGRRNGLLSVTPNPWRG
jgi:hypothetical protein